MANKTDKTGTPKHEYHASPPVIEYGMDVSNQPVQLLFRDRTNGDVLVTATLAWVISTLPEDTDKPLEHGCQERHFTSTPHQGEAMTLAGFEYYKTASMLGWSEGARDRLIARRTAHLSVVKNGDGGGYLDVVSPDDGDVS